MRTKNARPIDALESAWLADVKSVPCVFCDDMPPVEAHHPRGCQGLHMMAIAACPSCHNARVWTFVSITEMEATNETIRRVLMLRAGTPYLPQPAEPLRRSRERKRGSDKILPRRGIQK